MEEAVIASFDDIISAAQSVDDISVKIVNVAAEKYLESVSLEHPAAVASRATISGILKKNLRGPAALLESYQEFADLVSIRVEDYVENWASGQHSLEESEAEIERLAELAVSIENKSESTVTFRMVSVDASSAREALIDAALKRRAALLDYVALSWHQTNHNDADMFDSIIERLNVEPETTEGMDELEKFVLEVEGQMELIDEKISHAKQVYATLSRAKHLLEDDSSGLFWGLCYWPVQLAEEMDDVRARLAKFRGRYLTQLKQDQAQMIKVST